MKTKKKGSALLLTLAIAMIIIIILVVLFFALSGTTKGNAVKKENDDIFYAAESGLEFGINSVRTIDGKEDFNKDVPSYKNIDGSLVNKVNVTFKATGKNKGTLTSVATGQDGKEEKIIAPVYKPDSGDNSGLANVLQYGLATPKGKIIFKSPIQNQITLNTNVNSYDGIEGNHIVRPNGLYYKPFTDKDIFNDLVFKKNDKGEEYIKHVKRIEIDSVLDLVPELVKDDKYAATIQDLNNGYIPKNIKLSRNGSSFINMKSTRVSDEIASKAEGVGYFNYNQRGHEEIGIRYNHDYKIVMINADELVIDLKNKAENREYIKTLILITNADVTIKNVGTLEMLGSNIYGKSITFESIPNKSMNVNVKTTPMQRPCWHKPKHGQATYCEEGYNPGNPNYMLGMEVNDINVILNKYIDNWPTIPTDGGFGEPGVTGGWQIDYDNIQYN